MAKRTRSTSTKRWLDFIEAANELATDVILCEGVMFDGSRERDVYDSAVRTLMEKFSGGYTHTDLDDVMTYEEAEAKEEAAYMLGMAIGMRMIHRGDPTAFRLAGLKEARI